jgi:hypothetical protein
LSRRVEIASLVPATIRSPAASAAHPPARAIPASAISTSVTARGTDWSSAFAIHIAPTAPSSS